MKTAFKRFMLATAVAGMLTLCACSAGGGDGGSGVAGTGDVDGTLSCRAEKSLEWIATAGCSQQIARLLALCIPAPASPP